MKFTLEQILNVFRSKGYAFDNNKTPGTVNIIGVRSNNTIANSFDDYLYLHHINGSGTVDFFEFPITTDPGKYWLENPLNVKGTAILVPGQYKDTYAIGLHQGKYEALKQQKPVKVWRDNNNDDKLDFGGAIHEGIFGINIHRSNAKSESSVVEKWSAGCQVFKRVKDFNYLMDVCKKSPQKYFTYTLLEEKDF